MALLTPENFIEHDISRPSVHKSVDATYSTFEIDGKKYFQIDTYGSSDRKITGKQSQSIQIDQEMAKELLPLLLKTLF